VSDAEVTARLAGAYSELAPFYVDLWAPVLRPMGRQLLERLPLAGAAGALDLGTGTGTLLDDIAAASPAARIVAADFSEGMLRVAAAAHRAGFVASDARRLALRDGCVDVVVSAFVLFNLDEPAAALREVIRVLRPGGAFGMTTWGDESPPPDPALDVWVEELTAHGAPPGDPPPAGREQMNTPPKLEGLLLTAGFEEPHTWTDRLNHTWRADDCLEFLQHWKTKARLDALPAEARRSCIERAGRRITALTSEELTDRSEVVFATARAPGRRTRGSAR